jgi:hypothetical protein
MKVKIKTIITLEDDKGNAIIPDRHFGIEVVHRDKWVTKSTITVHFSLIWKRIQEMIKSV